MSNFDQMPRASNDSLMYQPKFSRIAERPANGGSIGSTMMAVANWRFSPATTRGNRRCGMQCKNMGKRA